MGCIFIMVMFATGGIIYIFRDAIINKVTNEVWPGR